LVQLGLDPFFLDREIEIASLSAPLAGTRLSGNPPRPSPKNMLKQAGAERAMRSVPARAPSHIVIVMVI
jgi:hypothetical protein